MSRNQNLNQAPSSLLLRQLDCARASIKSMGHGLQVWIDWNFGSAAAGAHFIFHTTFSRTSAPELNGKTAGNVQLIRALIALSNTFQFSLSLSLFSFKPRDELKSPNGSPCSIFVIATSPDIRKHNLLPVSNLLF